MALLSINLFEKRSAVYVFLCHRILIGTWLYNNTSVALFFHYSCSDQSCNNSKVRASKFEFIIRFGIFTFREETRASEKENKVGNS